MRIFITGATGTIGRRLVADRAHRGDRVIALSRHPARARELFAPIGRSVEVVAGDARFSGIWQQKLEACDAIVHLAGHNTSHERWTVRIRREIRVSRLESAKRLIEGVRSASVPPKSFVVASSVAAFGDRGSEVLDDRASYGSGFLAGLAAEFESECARGETLGMRVVTLRLGAVLDPFGGMLARLAPWFRRGCGVIPGKGTQAVPWIHWRDAVGMFDWAIASRGILGSVNAVAPELVQWSRLSNEFATRCGAGGMAAPVHAVPAIVMRILLGQGASEYLASRHAVASRATMHGFRFEFPQLAGALDECCAEWSPSPRSSLLTKSNGQVLVEVDAKPRVDAVPLEGIAFDTLVSARVDAPLSAVEPPQRTDGVLIDLDHGLSASNGRLLPDAREILETIARHERAHFGLFSQRPSWELPDLAVGPLATRAQLLSGGTLLRTTRQVGNSTAAHKIECSRIPVETVVELLKRLGAFAPRIGLVFEHPDGFDTPEPNRLRHPQHGHPIFITRVCAISELEVAETMRIHLVGGAEERGTVVEWIMREFVANGTLSLEAKSPWIVSMWATVPTRALAHEFAMVAGLDEHAHAIPIRSITELRRGFRHILEPPAKVITTEPTRD